MLRYMITDSKYSLEKIKKAIKKHKPDFVCYRNKRYFDKKEIIEFIEFAKNYSKVFINYDDLKDKFLLELVDGIHFPSKYLNNIPKIDKITIASTHNLEEVQQAKTDFITFSPIFNSKNRKGLGIEKLNEACDIFKSTIALGGIISDKQVKEVKNSKAIGFASIRYFFN